VRIGHNISALNTYRQLITNNSNSAKAIEKLSSSQRINKAGDDAAGLAISEKMRSQIRGLYQASRNAQDAVSMIQTAEGAASTVHAMLQRARELAVQAASDVLTDTDRASLNSEISQIKSQIDCIAQNTEFNTLKMLNGNSSSGGTVLDGVSESVINALKEQIPLWIDDALSTVKNNFGITLPSLRPLTVTLYQDTSSTAPAASMGTSDGGATLELKVNLSKLLDANNQIPPGTGGGQFDTVIAHEIMHAMQFTAMSDLLFGGVSAAETWFMEGLATAVQGGNGFLTPPNSSAYVDLSAWTGTSADYGSAFAAIKTLHEITVGGINAIIDELESGNSLDAAINNTSQTLNADPALTTADLVNPQVDFTTFAQFINWFNNSTDVDNYLDNSTDFTGMGSIPNGSDPTSSYGGTLEGTIANDTTIDNPNVYTITFTNVVGSDASGKTLNFQVGANENQSIEFNSVDMTVSGLGITNLNISTSANARAAIVSIDSAISKVSRYRGTFGALQNRLEYTIKNLDNAAENITSSESRIRDTDMAKELMSFTKNNILVQAAQSMLAQANKSPEGVLQLLK
jgi:flagellin